jgi:hypothetical protein
VSRELEGDTVGDEELADRYSAVHRPRHVESRGAIGVTTDMNGFPMEAIERVTATRLRAVPVQP